MRDARFSKRTEIHPQFHPKTHNKPLRRSCGHRIASPILSVRMHSPPIGWVWEPLVLDVALDGVEAGPAAGCFPRATPTSAGCSPTSASAPGPGCWPSTRPRLLKPARSAATAHRKTARAKRSSSAQPAGISPTPITMRRSTSWRPDLAVSGQGGSGSPRPANCEPIRGAGCESGPLRRESRPKRLRPLRPGGCKSSGGLPPASALNRPRSESSPSRNDRP